MTLPMLYREDSLLVLYSLDSLGRWRHWVAERLLQRSRELLIGGYEVRPRSECKAAG